MSPEASFGTGGVILSKMLCSVRVILLSYLVWFP